LTENGASGYIRAVDNPGNPSAITAMSSSTGPQASTITAVAPTSDRWQGMAGVLTFGALLGSLYGAVMGVGVAGLLHALQYLSFDAHGNPLAGKGQDFTDLYIGGAVAGAAIGAVSLMLLSGGMVVLLGVLQQLCRRT
jgi:hypothetical protein